MRILVCGSRGWTDREAMRRAFLALPDEPITIVHGGARGADSLAGSVATEMGFNVEVCRADWDRHGKSAGYKRNVEMLATKPDMVVAFWDGLSRGTKHMLDLAEQAGVKVLVCKS